ncbi:coiled-coil domain-containing protein 186-like isoform X2 [Venturia canescens]|uniref:coiled-coil domain-containing protein 186-like isoform X2 n=1 Tax=Venturia canescens TaxID=32260 RepID=UPI001C9C8342|nr:coiled-coil domain-containing protein 186-like isoform X2 [Venturia canescens]
MQDHGPAVKDFRSQSDLENGLSLLPREVQDSVQSLHQDPVTMSLINIDSDLGERDDSMNLLVDKRAESPNEQNLPEKLSSNFENIPLNSAKNIEQLLTRNGSEISNDNNEKSVQSDDENLANFTHMISTENNSFLDNQKPNFNGDFCITKEPKPDLPETIIPLMNKQNYQSAIDDSRCKDGIENSQNTQTIPEREKKNKEQVTVVETLTQQRFNTEKTPTLCDDSKLVKISLPTSSLNLMQSNTQFLNKSRNFLNFITEKSTNIMEKTLLPQNLAIRYNSIMKITDVTPSEKKNFSEFPSVQESSSSGTATSSHISENTEISTMTESPKTNVTMFSCEEKHSADSKTPESTQRSEKSLYEENPMQNSIPQPEIGESMTTEPSNSVSLTNDCSGSSDNNVEIDNSTTKCEDSISSEIPGLENTNSHDPVGVNVLEFESHTGLLKHPVYLTLVGDYAKLREEKIKLAERVEVLEAEKRILEAQNSGELFNVQLEALEKTVERLTVELRAANANQDELGREYAAANKERESMVMKYAVSEKQLIDTQRAREFAERRYKEIAKDYELLQNKLRQAQSERTRICNILDTKCRELTDSQKEVEKLKEDVNVRDVKLKWTQTKLKTEMESHKETQQKLDKATARMNDMREECEQIRRESQEMIREFQHSEENKAVTLDHQLKEQQARLILERHVTEDKEILRLQLQKEVDQLKNRQLALIEENNTLSLKIQDLEKTRLSYENKISEFKNMADQRQKEIVDLSAKVSHLETMKLQLIHKEQCLMSNEAEVERLRQVNQELQADMDCCRQREAHMLDFTQKLTDKNVRLQSEFTAIEAKTAQLEQEQGPLRERIAEFKEKIKTLEENLAYEKSKRIEECEILAKHLAEQTQIAQNLTQKLEESQGEIAVLKRKQQISVKEMARELQQCRKRLEIYDNASPSNSLDPTSRAGSNNSLNAGETLNGASSDHSGNSETTIQTTELDRQALIDRILKMQKINVRRAEKLDFLEEHTRTLVAELQKKTKIIQNYILHENFDAMGSNERDRHKAELARYGGIMASVYSQRVADDTMTLELSLEINQKLQAVLEDALLKNITLKDNIDTLGEEIARLTIKNQQLLQQKGK